jgi:hypothetical protein
MATRITHFLHSSAVTGVQVLGTAFAAADVHIHDLTEGQAPVVTNKRNWYGIAEGLIIKLTSAGSPTTVTIRICADADGDEVLVPDTTATLVPGITTSTVKSAAFSIKLPLFQLLNSPGNGNLYVFAKVDNGTGNPVMAQTTLLWSE